MSLYVLGPVAALIVAAAIYLIERGPIIGLRWLRFLRDLRKFREDCRSPTSSCVSSRSMRMIDETRKQIEDVYRRMAEKGKYRPAAPSDGFGNVTVPEDELDLDAEAASYPERWWKEEDRGEYNIGVPDQDDRKALIFTVEAARLMCGMDRGHAARLLRMAADELDGK